MDKNLFQIKPLVEKSLMQRLFRQSPDENAVIELNNLLAIKPVKSIYAKDIEEIENRYKLSLRKEFKLNLEEFYAVYLNYCLKDQTLSQQELEDLNHLKHILNLDGKTIDKLHAKIGENIYKQSFQEAVSDGRLTKDEENFLNRLEDTLRLPKKLAERISAEIRVNFIETYISKIIADQRLSPAEEEELQAISNSLNVSIQVNKQTREQLNKLKLYWALENLNLPIIQPDILIQKSEICHIRIPDVNWYELRKVSQNTTRSSYSTSFQVAKGFYLRSENNTSRNSNIADLKLIDTGTLYLTNKRIIFTGTQKNSNIRIDKIIYITPFTDGVQIGKETGKSPMLQMKQGADVFCIMLERILNER